MANRRADEARGGPVEEIEVHGSLMLEGRFHHRREMPVGGQPGIRGEGVLAPFGFARVVGTARCLAPKGPECWMTIVVSGGASMYGPWRWARPLAGAMAVEGGTGWLEGAGGELRAIAEPSDGDHTRVVVTGTLRVPPAHRPPTGPPSQCATVRAEEQAGGTGKQEGEGNGND